MPTYKNVSDAPLDWISTGHMEPGEIKSLADEIEHPSLERVDDNELVTLQATEPETPATPEEQAAAEQATPVTPPAEEPVTTEPPVQPPAPAEQPPAVNTDNVTETQGA